MNKMLFALSLIYIHRHHLCTKPLNIPEFTCMQMGQTHPELCLFDSAVCVYFTFISIVVCMSAKVAQSFWGFGP